MNRITILNKIILLFASFLLSSLLIYFHNSKSAIKTVKSTFITDSYINKQGNTITSRILIPSGYHRTTYPNQSFQNYLRNYKLKPFGAKVINYDGSTYFNQTGHVGVLEMPVPSDGLQQCADALIRLRAEYLWDTNKKDKIGFKFTSGHYVSWTQYANGIRPKISGNKVSFSKIANTDYSNKNFYNYLKLINMYAGTLSLYTELPKIKDPKIQLGDMLVNPGTPGHIVIIMDEIINAKGEKLYLLAQGNTPAQTMHVLKNVQNTKFSPWIELKNNTTIDIPGYTFNNSQFIRFKE